MGNATRERFALVRIAKRFVMRAARYLIARLEPDCWYPSLVDGEQSIDVDCPYCESIVGAPCRRSLPGKRPHIERRLDALHQLDSRK
jgi:hypothetical protein